MAHWINAPFRPVALGVLVSSALLASFVTSAGPTSDPGAAGQPDRDDRAADPVRHARVQPPERGMADRPGRIRPPLGYRHHVVGGRDGSGCLRLTKLDAAVANAQSHGVNDILMVLAGTPLWASSDPTSGGAAGVLPGAAGMPSNLADWDDWVAQVVTRYKGRITAYQPWNEANLSTFFTGTPAQMADLTQHAYTIIKSIDPAATVVAPSTGTRLGGPFKKFYPAFLRELKARGWPVDAFAAHTYPASLGTPGDRAGLAQLWISTLKAAKAPNLPLWDTENNFGLAGPGPSNPDQDINGTKAADWTARTYLDALRLGISRVYWYAWGPDLDLVGIQMNTGSPAATAYATVQDWIVGAKYNGCIGTATVACNFAKGGVKTQIVWTEKGTKSVVIPKQFKKICRLDGSCSSVGSRKTIQVSSRFSSARSPRASSTVRSPRMAGFARDRAQSARHQGAHRSPGARPAHPHLRDHHADDRVRPV